MNLRTKLLFPTLTISLFSLVFIGSIATLGFKNLQMQSETHSELAASSASLVINNSLESMVGIAHLIQSKETLINSLEMENQFEVLDMLTPLSGQSMLDFAIVYDNHLEVFARSDRPGVFGQQDKLFPTLHNAITKNEESFYTGIFEEKLAVIFVKPLNSINGASGVLVVGKYIDESFLNIQQGDHLIQLQARFQGEPPITQDSQKTLVAIPAIDKLDKNEIQFFYQTENLGRQHILRVRFFLVLIVVIAAFLILLVFSFRTINRISRRIAEVVAAAPLLVKGNFPSMQGMMNEEQELSSMVNAIEEANTAINQYNSELQQALSEKTIANFELGKTRDAAIEMAVAKSQFLSNMSHEIRTPMNGVLGLLESLNLEQLDEENRNLIEIARQSGEDLIRIVNDILIFSKLDVGKVELELRPFNLSQEISRNIQLLTPLFEEKHIKIDVKKDIDVKSTWLRGDVTRIGQVLKNLLGNAQKFSARDSIIGLEISCHPTVKNEARLEVSISDSGIGIAPDLMESIFDSFKQADGSVTRRFGGTGLGLAICKKLVTLMNGEIWVESIVGVGSKFSFYVHLEVEQQYERLQKSKPRKARKDVVYEGAENIQLLLVDDNNVNVIVAKSLLKKMGFDADVATNGQEALDAVEKTSYDLVLMDCQMPVMDGYEATRQIRHRKLNLPVIAVTANAMPGDREKCLEAGMNDYLTKPIRHGQLKEKLDQYLKPTSLV